MQFPRQDKAVRFRGNGFRFRGATCVVGVLALASLVLSCASAVRYATGPLAPSALPTPVVCLAIGSPPGQVPSSAPRQILRLDRSGPPVPPGSGQPDVNVLGRVRRLATMPGPAHGFHLEIDVPKGVLLADVLTYAPVRLDLAEGKEVRLRAFLGDAMMLRLDDTQGPLFLVSAGAAPPEAKDLPLDVHAAPRRAYVEVLSAEDLCQWTILQRGVEVTARGTPLGTIGPGATATFETQGRRWQITASEAATPDESDCGREGASRLAFFWTRLPPAP